MTKTPYIIGSAVAALAAGLLAPIGVANAAPECSDYIYPSSFEFKQDNNILTAFNNNGNRFDGPGASYTLLGGGGGDTRGSSTGVRNGRDITIDATWNNGFTSHVTGRIDDDLFARGTIVNNQGASNTWVSLAQFKCVPVAAPVNKPVDDDKPVDNKPAALTATVTQESTLYKAADGEEPYTDEDGIEIFLDPGPVTLVEPCSDKDYCLVFSNKVPGGQGYSYRPGFITIP